MTDDALPLDSPRWSALSTPSGHAGDVPRLLSTLFDRRSLSLDDNDTGPWFRLFDRLYHQQSLYGATFAAMPHLVRLASIVDRHARQELCVLFGMIAGARLVHAEPVPPDLAPAFARASGDGAEMTLRLLASEPIGKDAVNYLAFGALALVGHPAGRLVHANVSIASPPEVECECSACGASYLVLLLTDGTARYVEPGASPAVADPGQPALRLPHPPRAMATAPSIWSKLCGRFDDARRDLRSIDGKPLDDASGEIAACLEIASAVCRTGIDSRTDRTLALAFAAAVAMLQGNAEHGRQLLRLAGPVRCPVCEAVEPLASQMLEFADA